jgi:hypothetical protein
MFNPVAEKVGAGQQVLLDTIALCDAFVRSHKPYMLLTPSIAPLVRGGHAPSMTGFTRIYSQHQCSSPLKNWPLWF